MSARLKKLTSRLLYAVFLLGFVVFVAWVAFLRYQHRLAAGREDFTLFVTNLHHPGIDDDIFTELGWYQHSPARAPSPRPKAVGVARLVALGDSYTYGDEVAPGMDFPSQLERMLHGRVEVLNLGVSGYGFGQAFHLWETYASRLDADAVLLGPACFQSWRDLTFAHGGETSLNVHGRYVLSGEDVRFVAPEGGPDSKDVVEDYYSFFEPWRYLRYDRATPMFLRGFLPQGRSLANPFYYRRDSESVESQELYRRLLTRLDGSTRGVLLVHMDAAIVRLAASAGPRSFAAPFEGSDWGKFPNWRVAHPSANGYWLVAKAFADVLTGARAIELPELAIEEAQAATGDTPVSLDRFSRSAIFFDGDRIGRFIYLGEVGKPDEVVDFARDHIRSLVAFTGAAVMHGMYGTGPGLLDSWFVASAIDLAEGMPLELEVGSQRRVALDRLRLLPGVAVGSVRVPGLSKLVANGHMSHLVGRELAERAGVDFAQLPGAQIVLGGHALYRVEPFNGEHHRLVALQREAYPRPGSDEFFDPTRRDHGEVFLQLDAVRVPIGRWRVQTRTIPYEQPPFVAALLHAWQPGTLPGLTPLDGATPLNVDSIDGREFVDRHLAIDGASDHVVLGWAIDQAVKRPAGGVVLLIDGAAQRRAEYGALRSDVGQARGPTYERSGWSVRLKKGELSRGRHVVRLLTISADGKSYYRSAGEWALEVR